MKVALVTSGQETLGIEYLSSVIKSKGHEVRFYFDPQTFGGGIFFKIAFLQRKLDLKDKVVAKILEWQPDIIGFSCMTHNYPWSLQIAQKIKEQSTIPIIFGGIHPTSIPEEVLTNSCIDMVAVGEGEASFAELVDKLENKEFTTDIKGIYFKKNGKIIPNPPAPPISALDSIPYPDKQLFFDKVPAFKKDPYSIMTSRGCPYACTYCCNDVLKRLYKGYKFLRQRSVENVLGELQLAKEKFNISEVFFQDEIFALNLAWLEEFSERYKKEIGLPFQIVCHFKYATEKSVKLWKSAGCHSVVFGLQSASERIRRDVCKRFHSNDEAKEAIKRCQAYGINVFIEHLMGLPFESENELIEAVDFYRETSPNLIYTYWLTYFPATSIIQKGKEAGLLSEDDIRQLSGGPQSFYHKGTSIKDRDLNLKYQALFDLIPLLPKKFHQWITAHRWLWKLVPKGYLSHFGFLWIAGLKLGKTEFIRRIRLLISKKYVP